MSITRPPAMSDEEADERRASGGRVYQSAEDPRMSRLLNLVLAIATALMIAALVGTFTTLLAMREQLAVLTNRPEPASREQVAYLQRQIDEIKSDISKERDRARR